MSTADIPINGLLCLARASAMASFADFKNAGPRALSLSVVIKTTPLWCRLS
jgi:predicted naringenin-chalcone synthase